MIIERVQRVANPTRRKRRVNPKRRVKLSAAQIAAGFGGKRRRAALKPARKRKYTAKVANPRRRALRPKRRRVAVKATNPRRRRRHVAKAASPRRRRRVTANPARRRRISLAAKPVRRKRRVTLNPRRKRRTNPQIMALGFLNPQRSTMRKRKTTHRRRRHAVAANPRRRRRHVMRASNPRRRHRRHVMSNPSFFGNGMEAVGVLGGVTAQKLLKGFIPSSLTGGSALMSAGASIGLALLVGKGSDMFFKGKPIGKGIALGALASAASDVINAFVPSLGIGISGLGVYQPALFAVPENPIMRALPTPSVPVAAKSGMGMLNAAFGNSF